MKSRKPKILVVDDMMENIELLGSILSPDHEVAIAMNGQKALKIAEADPHPDLILLDVVMPEMDGLTVCRTLKRNAYTRRIPVIFVTTLGDVADEAQGFAAGGVDYITKPVSPPIVRARVQAHLALHDRNLALEAQVQERTRELLQTRDVAIFSLSSLAETRDNETGDHIRRTQFYMRLLARKLIGKAEYRRLLDDETIELLQKSAPLHDVGKVGIPDAILLKPGPLTPEEFTIMKRHTTIGREAITGGMRALGVENVSSFLEMGREIAYTHHEKWDGSGYPEGLAGETIPLPGRLMAICDVYDALISRRVYKAPFSHEEAVEIMREGKGKHFAPDLIDVFLELENEFLMTAYRHTDLPEEKASLQKSAKKRGLE